MERRGFDRIKFPGFGRCIYCGSDGGRDGLRDEHIVPYSLGGTSTIVAGSCSNCERKTSYLDGVLARGFFADHRLHSNIQSRTPKSQRPTEKLAEFKLGNTEFARLLPLSEHPYSVVFPEFKMAGILTGRPPSDEANIVCHHSFIRLKGKHPDPSARIADTPGIGVKSSVNYKPLSFLRAIARIAYSAAVAEFGIDHLDPLHVPDLILGRYTHANHYVGGLGLSSYPPNPNALHSLEMGLSRKGDDDVLQCVDVRLFANLEAAGNGPPIYRCVVGRPKGSADELRRLWG